MKSVFCPDIIHPTWCAGGHLFTLANGHGRCKDLWPSVFFGEFFSHFQPQKLKWQHSIAKFPCFKNHKLFERKLVLGGTSVTFGLSFHHIMYPFIVWTVF
jgi:hypothetical protein